MQTDRRFFRGMHPEGVARWSNIVPTPLFVVRIFWGATPPMLRGKIPGGGEGLTLNRKHRSSCLPAKICLGPRSYLDLEFGQLNEGSCSIVTSELSTRSYGHVLTFWIFLALMFTTAIFLKCGPNLCPLVV